MGTTLLEVVVTKTLGACYKYYKSLTGFSISPQISSWWVPVSKQGLIETVSTKFTETISNEEYLKFEVKTFVMLF